MVTSGLMEMPDTLFNLGARRGFDYCTKCSSFLKLKKKSWIVSGDSRRETPMMKLSPLHG